MYNILVAIDNSDYSKNAMSMACEIAKNIGAKVNILFVIENKLLYHPFVPMMFNPVMDGYDLGENYTEMFENSRESIKKFGREALEKAVEYCKKQEVEAVCYLREGILSEEIKNLANDNDLIIMGIFGLSSKFSGGLLGSGVEEVARIINKPLLLAPEKVEKIEKVAIAFDNSEYANKTLRLSFWMKKIWKSDIEFEVFSVIEHKDEEKEMTEIINGLIAEHPEYKSRILLSDNRAEMIINHVTESEFDLLMMGAYGHSRIRELILGGTTSEVIRKIRVPVLLNR
ncbi:MAG: universal stress protein [Candidatus Muiribacteriota bacterium]